MDKTKKTQLIFRKIVLLQELYTCLVPVPAAISAFIFSSNKTAVEKQTFLILSLLASIVTVTAGILIKYFIFKPVRQSIRLMACNQTDDTLFIKAKKIVYRLPGFDAICIFIRWNVAVGFIVVMIYIILKGITIANMITILVIGFLNGILAFPLYYIICEFECAVFMNLPLIREIVIPEIKPVNLTFKLLFSLLSVVVYLTVTVTLTILLSVLGYTALDKAIYSIMIQNIGSLITVAVLIYYISKSISYPIKMINAEMVAINRSKGNLSRKLDIFTNDDIGEMSVNFNQFLNFMSTSLENIQQASIQWGVLGLHLSASTSQNSEAIREIADTMNIMNERITLLYKEIEKTNSSLTGMNQTILRTATVIEDQTHAVGDASATIEMIVNVMGRLERNTDDKKRMIGNLSEEVRNGEERMKDTVALIGDILKSTEIIGEFMDVINNIASRTDLLAMNAAIEAAHAGVYGKGFSVVADEIKKLAEETGVNVQSISNALKEIIGKIKYASQFTDKTGMIIVAIIRGINEVSDSMNEILTGLNEITTVSKQITHSLSNLVKTTDETKNHGKYLDHEIAQIDQFIQTIFAQARDNKTGIEEITTRLNNITESISGLSDLSLKNTRNIEMLENEISKFK